MSEDSTSKVMVLPVSLQVDEDLHSAAETKDEVKSGLLLNVIVGKSATVFELLASEDQALLIGRITFLVLDLGLDIVDGVGGLDLQNDGLAGQSLDEDLHSTTETEDKVKSRLLLNVAVGQGATALRDVPEHKILTVHLKSRTKSA